MDHNTVQKLANHVPDMKNKINLYKLEVNCSNLTLSNSHQEEESLEIML